MNPDGIMLLIRLGISRRRLCKIIFILILIILCYGLLIAKSKKKSILSKSTDSKIPRHWTAGYDKKLISDKTPFVWCRNNQSMDDISDGPNCDKLFNGDQIAIEESKLWTPPCSRSDKEMEKITCDCYKLKKLFHFPSTPLSEDEENFPLAFVFIVQKNSEQVIRLLASLYQPQNLFCITYDDKSNEDFKRSMRCLKKCFFNVILPKKHFAIHWGHISILDATMNCMKSLVVNQTSHKWKYLQILSWNDVPLRTNLEMVKIFKIFNGSSDSELKRSQKYRYDRYYAIDGEDKEKKSLSPPAPPHNMEIYKGSFSVSLPRNLCNYLINDQDAKEFLKWSRHTWCPEEQFFSSIIHNTRLNHDASFPGVCLEQYSRKNLEKAWISRFQVWYDDTICLFLEGVGLGQLAKLFCQNPCAGQIVRDSCCFGVGDLSLLSNQPHLVAHKFYADFEPAAWYCMLKWHHARTYHPELAELSPLDLEYYKNLPAVRFQRFRDKPGFVC